MVYTDISADGMQTGVSVDAYRRLIAQVGQGVAVIASGGVASLSDIRALAAVGPPLEGAIVGRALYEGAFTVEEAVEAARHGGGGGAGAAGALGGGA
jgi:phosphoribosylformimino-5-aminoimidazole carboxamide ribotide isomerase